jgi:regulator of protease activity HflC (stomatin/prohibitin superfamily)
MVPAFFFLLVMFAIVAILNAAVMVRQGTVAVITRFGKFQKIATAGLNFKTPFLDNVYVRISLQNRSIEVKFQAITQDQANVYFNAMILYSVLDNSEPAIENVAFKFRSDAEFQTALSKTVEGAVRAYVAGKRQSEVLILRKEIVEHVKGELDQTLQAWGYHLQDMQMNDITFDREIMESMSKVVASNNLKAAAENEGQALLITKTKAAEAEGRFITISAQSERDAAKMRGEGVAQFREEVAKGMSQAVQELGGNDLASFMIMFSMWTEAMKNIAEVGKGNVLFFDGSPEGMSRTMKQIEALMISKGDKSAMNS